MPVSPTSTSRSIWMHALRISAAFGLLWFALHDEDMGHLLRIVTRPSRAWVAGVMVMVVLDRILMAWRWILLVRAVEPQPPVPTRELMRVFFASSLIGTMLPGSVGGDAVRALSASRLGLPTSVVMGSVAVDRLIGTVSVLLMAVAGLLLAGRLLDGRILMTVAGVTGLATGLTMILLFDSRALPKLVALASRGRFPTLERMALKGLASLRQYGDHRRPLLAVLGLSVAVQLLRTTQAWGLGLALGINIDPLWYFAWIPLIVVILLLPISIAGLGSGNIAFEQLFSVAGVDQASAIALSVWFLVLGPLGTLPGGIAALVLPSKRRS